MTEVTLTHSAIPELLSRLDSLNDQMVEALDELQPYLDMLAVLLTRCYCYDPVLQDMLEYEVDVYSKPVVSIRREIECIMAAISYIKETGHE